MLIAPTKYEREVRRVSASLSPEVQRLRRLLPVDALAGVAGKVGNLVLDAHRRRVTAGSVELHLTPSQFQLLRTLAARPDQAVPRRELAQAIWGHDGDSVGRALDIHVRRLRAALATAPAPAPAILSIRGFGHRLVAFGPHHFAAPGASTPGA